MKKHVFLITIELLLAVSMFTYASHPLGSDSFYANLKQFLLFRDPQAEGTTLQSSLTSTDGSTLVLDPSLGRVECSVLHLNAVTYETVEDLLNALEVGDMVRWLPSGELISQIRLKRDATTVKKAVLDVYPDGLIADVAYDWFIKLEDGNLYGFSRERQG